MEHARGQQHAQHIRDGAIAELQKIIDAGASFVALCEAVAAMEDAQLTCRGNLSKSVKSRRL